MVALEAVRKGGLGDAGATPTVGTIRVIGFHIVKFPLGS